MRDASRGGAGGARHCRCPRWSRSSASVLDVDEPNGTLDSIPGATRSWMKTADAVAATDSECYRLGRLRGDGRAIGRRKLGAAATLPWSGASVLRTQSVEDMGVTGHPASRRSRRGWLTEGSEPQSEETQRHESDASETWDIGKDAVTLGRKTRDAGIRAFRLLAPSASFKLIHREKEEVGGLGPRDGILPNGERGSSGEDPWGDESPGENIFHLRII
ncbi:hypothetical protein C8J57DRAFT_1242043 [Mycena rebaudengoi]|nr:hypothetical protein C8J57DRAFT_1242043 [Mycena rebaudengoi]